MSINDVMKELAKFKKKTSVNDQQILSKDMVNRLIEDALGKLRKDVDNLLGQISQNLNKKSEFEDLWKSEGNICFGDLFFHYLIRKNIRKTR